MAYTSNVSGGDVAFIYKDDAIDGTYAGQVTMNMEFCVRSPACETLYWFMPHHK